MMHLLRFKDDPKIVDTQFERIDDVIMGGGEDWRGWNGDVGTSNLPNMTPPPAPGLSRSALTASTWGASWRGVLRSEGGGFCGQRTKPQLGGMSNSICI